MKLRREAEQESRERAAGDSFLVERIATPCRESIEPQECLSSLSLETNECTTPLSEMEFSDGKLVTSSSLDSISDKGAMDSSLYESEDEAFTHS